MKDNRLHGVWIPFELLTSSDLSKTALILLSDMAYFKDYYKSRKEIAAMLQISDNTVSTLLSELEKGGYIEEVGHVFNRRIFTLSKEVRKMYAQGQTSAPPKTPPKPKSTEPEVVDQTEELIQETHKVLGGKRKLMITPKRVRRMKARLKKFTREDILAAADNLTKSSWHMGANPSGVQYATVDFLIRDDETIEKWANIEVSDQIRREVGNKLWGT